MSDSSSARSALEHYKQTLVSMSKFVSAVTLAKEGRWKEALMVIAANPRTWPLALRFGSEAIVKRLGFR
jgi:hypothetical protein